MSWEREPLWVKSRLFFEKAFKEDKEEQYFGLWCAMGLELLCRAAISNISPTLLAEPDREQQNLLHALNMGSAKTQKKSIATNQVLFLCKTLITDFVDTNYKIASAIINRRNEEVHSGGAAFLEYPTQQWLNGFYKCCKILAESQDESLESLFGDEIAKEAEVILAEVQEELIGKTKSLIAAHKKVFEAKEESERINLSAESEKKGELLSHMGHHRINCPACNSIATIHGESYGTDQVEHTDDEIIVRQSVLPTKFNCPACELKLTGYGALTAAGIADHFTHRSNYTPEEYYDMINPNDEHAMDRFAEEHGYYHFSND